MRLKPWYKVERAVHASLSNPAWALTMWETISGRQFEAKLEAISVISALNAPLITIVPLFMLRSSLEKNYSIDSTCTPINRVSLYGYFNR